MNEETTRAIELQQFESLIEGLLTTGYGCCDEFLDELQVEGLRNRLLSFHPEELEEAGIGKAFLFQKEKSIRGDQIHWIEPETIDPFEVAYFEKLDRFIAYLNRTCYTAINDKEIHYAKYPKGTFYKRHLDQFKIDNGRVFSVIIYLNDNWTENDGGEIGLYFGEEVKKLQPIGGRMIFFKSDEIEHEVFPSNTRNRLSLTGWLKSVNSAVVI